MQALKTAWKYDAVMLRRNQAEPNTVCFHGNDSHTYILYTPVTAGWDQRHVGEGHFNRAVVLPFNWSCM